MDFKKCDSQEDVDKRVKDCVDFAFQDVLDFDKLMKVAMQKSRGHCNPKMVGEEIKKRLSDKDVPLHEETKKTVTRHKGYDYFCPDPGKWDSCKCKVCGSEMDVKKDCYGPTSWAMAMSKSKRKYDEFACPHLGEEWHNKAYDLLLESENTASESVKRIVLNDLKKVVISNLN